MLIVVAGVEAVQLRHVRDRAELRGPERLLPRDQELLAGPEPPARGRGRQRHDAHQRARHQGLLQIRDPHGGALQHLQVCDQARGAACAAVSQADTQTKLMLSRFLYTINVMNQQIFFVHF